MRSAEGGPFTASDHWRVESSGASDHGNRGAHGHEPDALARQAHFDLGKGGSLEAEELHERIGQGNDVIRWNDDDGPDHGCRVKAVGTGRGGDELRLDRVAAEVREPHTRDEAMSAGGRRAAGLGAEE